MKSIENAILLIVDKERKKCLLSVGIFSVVFKGYFDFEGTTLLKQKKMKFGLDTEVNYYYKIVKKQRL